MHANHHLFLSLLLYNLLFNFLLFFKFLTDASQVQAFITLSVLGCVLSPQVLALTLVYHTVHSIVKVNIKWSHFKMELEPPFQRNSFAHSIFWNVERTKTPTFQEGSKNENILSRSTDKSQLCQVTLLPDHSMKGKVSLRLPAPRNLLSLITYLISLFFPLKVLSFYSLINTPFGFLPKTVYPELQFFDPK